MHVSSQGRPLRSYDSTWTHKSPMHLRAGRKSRWAGHGLFTTARWKAGVRRETHNGPAGDVAPGSRARAADSDLVGAGPNEANRRGESLVHVRPR